MNTISKIINAQNKVKVLDAHVVTSVYGNRSLDKRIALAEQEGRLIYDKNKDEEISQGTPQVQYERGINDKSSSNDSILNSPENNNKQIVNIENEHLAERDYPIDADIEKTVNNALSNSNSGMNTISKITNAQNKAINRLAYSIKNDSFRGKFEGGRHLISNDAIKHAIAEHGDFLREALRAQLPMTPSDIARHLSAVKDNKNPKDIKASNTKRGTPSIITAYEVNGYTLYAEEITKSLGENTPSDLIGHTMYKAPTLSTAAFYATSAQTQPKRQSTVLHNYYTTDSTNLSRGNFVTDINGEPSLLSYIMQNGKPKQNASISGLIALSSDKSNFTDKAKSFGQGYVVCKKPFYITADNRVFSNSETNVAEAINELKKQGYDCFIFDKVVGDNYMVAVVNKAQIVSDKVNFVADEDIQYSERNTENIYDKIGEAGRVDADMQRLEKDLLAFKGIVGNNKMSAKSFGSLADYLNKTSSGNMRNTGQKLLSGIFYCLSLRERCRLFNSEIGNRNSEFGIDDNFRKAKIFI